MPRFKKKPLEVEAVKITRPMTIEALSGTLKGEPGDWLVTFDNGFQVFIKDGTFKAEYEEIPDLNRLILDGFNKHVNPSPLPGPVMPYRVTRPAQPEPQQYPIVTCKDQY